MVPGRTARSRCTRWRTSRRSFAALTDFALPVCHAARSRAGFKTDTEHGHEQTRGQGSRAMPASTLTLRHGEKIQKLRSERRTGTRPMARAGSSRRRRSPQRSDLAAGRGIPGRSRNHRCRAAPRGCSPSQVPSAISVAPSGRATAIRSGSAPSVAPGARRPAPPAAWRRWPGCLAPARRSAPNAHRVRHRWRATSRPESSASAAQPLQRARLSALVQRVGCVRRAILDEPRTRSGKSASDFKAVGRSPRSSANSRNFPAFVVAMSSVAGSSRARRSLGGH